jgi:hypothetical protein
MTVESAPVSSGHLLLIQLCGLPGVRGSMILDKPDKPRDDRYISLIVIDNFHGIAGLPRLPSRHLG